MPRGANPEAAAAAAATSGKASEQDIPLDLPRKTRLYLEQMQREREQARRDARGPCMRRRMPIPDILV